MCWFIIIWKLGSNRIEEQLFTPVKNTFITCKDMSIEIQTVDSTNNTTI